MPRASLLLAALAALMGAAGVALAALSTHADGGEFGRTAAQFLSLHAAALLGLSAHARNAELGGARAMLIAGAALALGTVLFSGDLTMLAFAHARLFPFAAPTGGSLMILSWIALAIILAAGAARAEASA